MYKYMKWQRSKVEYIPQGTTQVAGYQHIEKAMRTCYNSADKITEDSWKKMLDLALTSKHHSVLEHMTIYLTVDYNSEEGRMLDAFFDKNPFSKVACRDDKCYITTNYRVLVENDMTWLVEKMVAPTKYHKKRYTFRVECSEAIAREWNRHRGSPGNSISQRSTRYCNYNKDKYGKELTFIVPEWVYQYCDGDIPADPNDMMNGLRTCNDTAFYYMNALEYAEHQYMRMIEMVENHRKPEVYCR